MNATTALAVGAGGVAAAALVVYAMRRRQVAAPAPPPACALWIVPSVVPTSIANRAMQILLTGPELGTSFIEQEGGHLWKYIVETHGPSKQIPHPHKGVGVRVCAAPIAA